jgi:hypothetical protein
MKIITGEELLTYPAGTVFYVYDHYTFERLAIKRSPPEAFDKNGYNAFMLQYLGDYISLEGSDHTGEMIEQIDKAIETGGELRVDREVTERWILEKIELQKFAVFDSADTLALIQVLQATLPKEVEHVL